LLTIRKWKLHAWVMAQYGLSAKRGEAIHHRDGEITNNLRENLVILTNQEHGRITRAESADVARVRTGRVGAGRKLTMDVAREIRAAYAAGRSTTSLAAEYEVTWNIVWNIVQHKTYKEHGQQDSQG